MRGSPVGQDGHVPGADGVARERLADGAHEPSLEPAVLPVEPRVDPRANLGDPLLAGRALGRRKAFEQRREHAAGVADQPERLVGRPDPPRVGVDVDEAAAELQGVVARRLGAELGADGEDRVGPGEKLLDGGLVGGGSGRERVIVREGALAHVGRHHGRAEALGDRAQLVPGAGAQHAAAGPDHGPLGVGEEAHGLGEVALGGQRRQLGRRVELAHGRRRSPRRARRRGSRGRPGRSAA